MARKRRKVESKRNRIRLRNAHDNDDHHYEEVEVEERCFVEEEHLDQMQVEGHANNNENVPKKKRGGTFKTDIYGRPPHKPPPNVHFTSRGIPIGKYRKDFVEFLGTLARNGMHAPLHFEDWRTMPNDNLEGILETVKKYFIAPPGIEGWILKSVGKKGRNWKSTLKKQYYKPSKPIEIQIANRDERVIEDQWRKLLQYWGTDKAKHEMDELSNQLPPDLVDNSSQNDIFAQVMGKERNGRVRMRGLGVTPNTEWGIASSRSILYRVFIEQQTMVEQLTEKVKQQDERYEEILSLLRTQNISPNNITRVQSSGSHNHLSSSNACQPPSTSNDPRPFNSCNASRPLRVHCSVMLKSITDQNTIVARGHLVSMDPSRDVGGTRLGEICVK